MKTFKKLLKNRTIIAIFCVVLALILVFVIAPIWNNILSSKTEIIRFKTEVDRGTRITANMLEKATVGKYNLPNDVIIDSQDAVGQIVIADVYPGDYVLKSKVTDELRGVEQMFSSLNGELQSVTVKISNTDGMIGKIESGDVVSLYAEGAVAPESLQSVSIEDNPDMDETGVLRQQNITILPPELMFVEVIGTFNSENTDVNEKLVVNEEDNNQVVSLMVLATPQQVEKIMFYSANGSIRASLACKYDNKSDKESLLKYQSEILSVIIAKQPQENNDQEFSSYREWQMNITQPQTDTTSDKTIVPVIEDQTDAIPTTNNSTVDEIPAETTETIPENVSVPEENQIPDMEDVLSDIIN